MKAPNSRTVAGSRIYAKAPDAPPTNDALAAKLAEAERELFLMRRVAEGNEAEIARLTQELDGASAALCDYEATKQMYREEKQANAALREVVAWAAKYVGNNTYEQRVEARMKLLDALAALEALRLNNDPPQPGKEPEHR